MLLESEAWQKGDRWTYAVLNGRYGADAGCVAVLATLGWDAAPRLMAWLKAKAVRVRRNEAWLVGYGEQYSCEHWHELRSRWGGFLGMGWFWSLRLAAVG